MNTEKRQDWVVGCGGSHMDSVGLTILKNATKQEVKEYLVGCVEEIKATDEDSYGGGTYESGTESIENVDEYKNELSAYADFTNCHYDWSAEPLCEVTSYEYPSK